jgi:hypothetical protein
MIVVLGLPSSSSSPLNREVYGALSRLVIRPQVELVRV